MEIKPIPHDPLYVDNRHLIARRKSKKKYRKWKRALTLREATKFVMPWGMYAGYYAPAILKHDPSYVKDLLASLATADRESSYDRNSRITDVFTLLQKRRE